MRPAPERRSGGTAYRLPRLRPSSDPAGPELSLPNVVRLEAPAGSGIRAAFTLVEFAYDARLSGRTAPDYVEALVKAREFIRDGTPIRTTNKAGAGMQGTRLVEGLGAVSLSLYIR